MLPDVAGDLCSVLAPTSVEFHLVPLRVDVIDRRASVRTVTAGHVISNSTRHAPTRARGRPWTRRPRPDRRR